MFSQTLKSWTPVAFFMMMYSVAVRLEASEFHVRTLTDAREKEISEIFLIDEDR